MIWTIVGWTLWGLVALLSLGHLASGNRDRGVRLMMRIQGFVLAVGLAATALFPFSKFHLLWVLPVAFITPLFVMGLRGANMERRFLLLVEESRRTGIPIDQLVERQTGQAPG